MTIFSKSHTLGSGLLVAGTSIGAGMLALPLVAAMTGLWWVLVLMLLMSGLACYGGLLIAEACRACPEAANLHGVVGKLLGRFGQIVTVFGMLFLYYSLCAAYISGGALILQQTLEKGSFNITHSTAVICVTVTAAVLVVAGTSLVDAVNRILFGSMLLLLLCILLIMIPDIRADHLSGTQGSPAALFAVLPVLYTSYGYHCAIPTVVRYVGGKPDRFRIALIGGSALPFSIYVIWMVAVIGVLSTVAVLSFSGNANAVSLLINALGDASDSSLLGYLVSGFAAFAIATSFLGVSLGLFDYLAEVAHRIHDLKGRIQTIILTLFLPLMAALFMPGSFVTALGYAAIALVILAVFIPVALVWKVRKLQMEEPYQVAGGKPALLVAILLGGLVIIAQLSIATGLLPTIG